MRSTLLLKGLSIHSVGNCPSWFAVEATKMCLKLKNLPKNGRNIHLDTLCRLRKGGSSDSRQLVYSNSRPNFKIKDIRKRKIDKKLIFMELIQFYSCCLREIWKSSVVHIQIRPICTTRFVSRVYHLESSSLDLVQHI